MKAQVGRLLAALTMDELREVRDRLDVIARDAGHPDVIASGGEVTVSGHDQGFEETVDDRSGWILERRGDRRDPDRPPVSVHRELVGEGWV